MQGCNCNYWLLKSEPNDYSWRMMSEDRVTPWDGVRSPQAIANMKKAKVGDLAFFYHSGVERAIQGVVRVVKNFYIPENVLYGHFEVEYQFDMQRVISLAEIKRTPQLSSMTILRQPRLSVAAITAEEWNTIMELSQKTCP
ncbi:EVE domain-containing protein [Anaplasma platys]|uniref:EVE domain-containing protein n=2 Tax=Anaplasma platys TaxID=949 RepID=A0A858PX19_9RICK|nr:EVE domain-containing protein [Anaplasma platys]